jgi:pilus assembly protein TadC
MNDAGPPWLLFLVVAAGVFALGVHGLRGLLAIHAAVRAANLDELANPPHWRVTRVFAGTCAALPVLLLQPTLGAVAYVAALIVGGLGYLVAPQFLDSVRLRVEREVLDDLTLHLDVMALAVESGSSLPAALALAVEHGPPGALRRAFEGVLVEVHAGAGALDALRGLDQRLQLRSFSTLVNALRSAERLGIPLAPILRERATQSAANRFARAERLARAAPLKLWATLVLCIAPCTLVVLALPIARLLALVVGRG